MSCNYLERFIVSYEILPQQSYIVSCHYELMDEDKVDKFGIPMIWSVAPGEYTEEELKQILTKKMNRFLSSDTKLDMFDLLTDSEEQDKLILDVGTKMTIKFVWSTENKNQYYVSEEDEKVSIGHVFIG